MKVHLHGFLINNEDGTRFEKSWNSVAQDISAKIPNGVESKASKCQTDDDYTTDTSLYIPNVFLQIHLSDKEITLEEAVNNQILSSIGELDIYTSWYGYSEYTIEGYTVDNFTIGGHDIEEILKSNVGKYAHIVMKFGGSVNE